RQAGVALHRLPQARNSQPYGGRSQCRACGTCFVCPTGAKASIDLTHVPAAEATGNARVIAEATVLRLELDQSGVVRTAIYATHAVSLGPNARDYFGTRAPHLHFALGPYEQQALKDAQGVARRILAAMQLTDIRTTPVTYAGHQIGTHRMGADARTSVVDAHL